MANLKLHQLFRLAREMQEISQTEVLAPVEKKQPSLSSYEKKGKATLSPETLEAMAPILKINKKYISNRSENPFVSNDLIKMFFIESMLGKIDYDFIHFLYTANKKLDVLFLYPPIPSIIRIFAHLGTFPVYAITIRDDAGNVFLFRRKNGNIVLASVTGTENLELEISENARKEGKRVSFNRILIENELYTKISNWEDVTKEDIERLFLPENQIPVLKEREYSIVMKLIKILRAGIISYEDIERFIEDKSKDKKIKKTARRS